MCVGGLLSSTGVDEAAVGWVVDWRIAAFGESAGSMATRWSFQAAAVACVQYDGLELGPDIPCRFPDAEIIQSVIDYGTFSGMD